MSPKILKKLAPYYFTSYLNSTFIKESGLIVMYQVITNVL